MREWFAASVTSFLIESVLLRYQEQVPKPAVEFSCVHLQALEDKFMCTTRMQVLQKPDGQTVLHVLYRVVANLKFQSEEVEVSSPSYVLPEQTRPAWPWTWDGVGSHSKGSNGHDCLASTRPVPEWLIGTVMVSLAPTPFFRVFCRLVKHKEVCQGRLWNFLP